MQRSKIGEMSDSCISRQAIEYYEKYTALTDGSQTIPQLGEAYNCMGVNYMLLACPASDAGYIQACEQTSRKRENLGTHGVSNEQKVQYLTNAIRCHET